MNRGSLIAVSLLASSLAFAQTTPQAPASGAKPGASSLPQSDIENPAVSDTSNLQNEIQGAMTHEPTLEGAQIGVAVKQGQIELTGTAPNGKARETARRIASSYAINQRVVDHIKVVTAPPPARQQSQSDKQSANPSATPPPKK